MESQIKHLYKNPNPLLELQDEHTIEYSLIVPTLWPNG